MKVKEHLEENVYHLRDLLGLYEYFTDYVGAQKIHTDIVSDNSLNNKEKAEKVINRVIKQLPFEWNTNNLCSQIKKDVKILTKAEWDNLPTVTNLFNALKDTGIPDEIKGAVQQGSLCCTKFSVDKDLLNPSFSVVYVADELPSICFAPDDITTVMSPIFLMQKNISLKAKGNTLIAFDFCRYLTDSCFELKEVTSVNRIANIETEAIFRPDVDKNYKHIIGVALDYINDLKDGEFDTILIGDYISCTDWLILTDILTQKNFTKTKVHICTQDYYLCRICCLLMDQLFPESTEDIIPPLVPIAESLLAKYDYIDIFKKDVFSKILKDIAPKIISCISH